MKRKVNANPHRDVSLPDIGAATVEPCVPPTTPRRSSMEGVDEHYIGSIESVPEPGAGETRSGPATKRRVGG